jgi:hypothetical protein
MNKQPSRRIVSGVPSVHMNPVPTMAPMQQQSFNGTMNSKLGQIHLNMSQLNQSQAFEGPGSRNVVKLSAKNPNSYNVGAINGDSLNSYVQSQHIR